MGYDIGFLLDGLILVFLSVTIFYAARLSLFLKSFREGKDGMQILIRDLSVTVDKAEESVKIMKGYAMETEEELRAIINEAKYLSDELRFMNESGDGLANRLEKLANRNRELVDLIENSGGIGTQQIRPLEEKVSQDPWAVAASAKKAIKEKLKSEKLEPQLNDGFEISDFDIDEDDEYDFHALDDGAYRVEEAEQHKPRIDTQSKSKVRSFAIFDRDHTEGQENIIKDDLALNDQDDEVVLSAQSDRQFHSQAEQDLYEALQRRKTKVSEVS